jgi:hypothetical protein
LGAIITANFANMAMGRRLIPFLAGGGLGVASLTIISRFDVADLDVSQTRDRGARAFPTSGRVDAERMYRRAIRHSRAVRTLRLVIPLALALGTLATILIATWPIRCARSPSCRSTPRAWWYRGPRSPCSSLGLPATRATRAPMW